MTISVGQTLPGATLHRLGANGPEDISVKDLTAGRKVVIFAVPGAFTPTCHSAHVPSFVRTRQALAAKGIDEVVCVAVNDVHVMKAWDQATGAEAAGITMLADDGSFTQALGLSFDVPAIALMGRSKRYAMMVEDGVVKVYHPETGRGCEISGGEAMLESL